MNKYVISCEIFKPEKDNDIKRQWLTTNGWNSKKENLMLFDEDHAKQYVLNCKRTDEDEGLKNHWKYRIEKVKE